MVMKFLGTMLKMKKTISQTQLKDGFTAPGKNQ